MTRHLLLDEHQVPHAMAQLQAAIFKLGQRTIRRLRRIAISAIVQLRLGAQHFQHLHRVIFPIGRAMQIATRRQAIGQLLDERRLDQTALVVARLVPWIGEKHVDAGQRIGWNHVREHFHGIVLQQAQIRQRLFADQLQQAADAGRVHFHADEILLRHGLGDMRRRRTHAKTDFQDDGRLAAKHLLEVHGLLGKRQQELRPQGLKRARLRNRQPSRAGHETADAVFGRIVHHRPRRAVCWGIRRHGSEEISSRATQSQAPAKNGAGEGNRTLVVSLGSSTRNSTPMRACGPFLLRECDIIAAPQATIHARDLTIVEQSIQAWLATKGHSAMPFWPLINPISFCPISRHAFQVAGSAILPYFRIGDTPMKLVDLFCGCGGFALGAHQAGFDISAAFDVDPILTSSYKTNFPDTNLQLRDVANLSGSDIEKIVGGPVDGVFGGPPCQGFSDIGLRDVNDPRRRLLLDFFRVVNELHPAFFVMENVKGLMNKDARPLLDEGIGSLSGRYKVFGPVLLDAADFGAATSRTRLFVMGFDTSRCPAVSMEDIRLQCREATMVRDAIGDLANAKLIVDPVGGLDLWQLNDAPPYSQYAENMRSKDGQFTGNRRTTHAERTIKRFSTVSPGKHDPVGRHFRLKWDGQCPTLRAGTGADHGSYQSVRPLHPDEPRVITVREAARLQGFPDKHTFHPTLWHSFRMIGNSVSPIMSYAIFSAIKRKLNDHVSARSCEQPQAAA